MAEAGKGFVEYSELGEKIKNKSPYFLIPAFNYKSNSCKRSLQEQQELDVGFLCPFRAPQLCPRQGGVFPSPYTSIPLCPMQVGGGGGAAQFSVVSFSYSRDGHGEEAAPGTRAGYLSCFTSGFVTLHKPFCVSQRQFSAELVEGAALACLADRS